MESPKSEIRAQAVPELVVFTLGERRESRRRRLLPMRWHSLEERLHRACLESALAAGREAGCRLRVCSPEDFHPPAGVEHRPQAEGGFGERLRLALAQAFDAAQGPVAVVGSDVPGLTARPLRRAFRLLAEDSDRVVIGPSPDGGFYLLASARPLDGALGEVRWCCGQTLESLRLALARRGREVVLLEPLQDLDHRPALELWLAAGGPPRLADLLRVLHGVLAALRRPLPNRPTFPVAGPRLDFRAPRGPPLPLLG
jgi:hypothetical protein